MSEKPISVDYLLDLAKSARSLPDHDPNATEAHSPAQIAVQAEQAVAALQRSDWRAAANIHFGLSGAIDDAAGFLGVVLDSTRSVDTRVGLIDALDKADARRRWTELPRLTAISGTSERIVAHLDDGSQAEAWLADAHDPVSTLMNWIFEQFGVEAVYDALGELLVRPGDSPTSHSRTKPI